MYLAQPKNSHIRTRKNHILVVFVTCVPPVHSRFFILFIHWRSLQQNQRFILVVPRATPSNVRLLLFDPFHKIALQLFLVNLDFIARPNTHRRLPYHGNIVFRRAGNTPVVVFSGRPAKVSRAGSMAYVEETRQFRRASQNTITYLHERRSAQVVRLRHRLAIALNQSTKCPTR